MQHKETQTLKHRDMNKARISPRQAAQKIGLKDQDAIAAIASFMFGYVFSWATYPEYQLREVRAVEMPKYECQALIRNWEKKKGTPPWVFNPTGVSDPINHLRGALAAENYKLLWDEAFFSETAYEWFLEEVKASSWAVITPGYLGELFQFKNWLHNGVKKPHSIHVTWGENGGVQIDTHA